MRPSYVSWYATLPAVVKWGQADGKDPLHAPLVEVFAKQGYHILCEKPMATTIADCVKMVKDVKASGGVFGMGHGQIL